MFSMRWSLKTADGRREMLLVTLRETDLKEPDTCIELEALLVTSRKRFTADKKIFETVVRGVRSRPDRPFGAAKLNRPHCLALSAMLLFSAAGSAASAETSADEPLAYPVSNREIFTSDRFGFSVRLPQG